MAVPVLLLVEDEVLVATTIKRRLRRFAITVVHVTDASHACAYLDQGSPVGIVWADFNLARGGNGLTVLHRASLLVPRPALLLVSATPPAHDTVPAGTLIVLKPDLATAFAFVALILRVPV